MTCIWFNPELNQYQYGSKLNLEEQKKHSSTPEEFKSLYEFNHTSEKLLEKVFQSLLVTSQEFNITASSN